MLSNDWLRGAEYWNEVDSVTVYVNPEQPTQAVHLQGWDGVLEEAFTLMFFTGIILGGYLIVGVPIWFVYAKTQRLKGIEAPKKSKRETGDLSAESKTGDDKGENHPRNASQDTDPAQREEDATDDAAPVGDENLQEEKFW